MCHATCARTPLFLLMPALATAAPPASHYRVSLHGPNANTAHSESGHPTGPGHHRRRPLGESEAHAHWHHSGRASRGPLGRLGQDSRGSSARSSSPGAEAVRHPPCKRRKQKRVTLPSAKPQRAQAAPRAQVLLPVKGIQGAEDDAAHGVVPPEEEPAGHGERAPVRPAGSAGTRGAGPLTRGRGVERRAGHTHRKSADRRRWASTSRGGVARGGNGHRGREAECGGK